MRKGPFRAGQSFNFRGKILYEECRKPVGALRAVGCRQWHRLPAGSNLRYACIQARLRLCTTCQHTGGCALVTHRAGHGAAQVYTPSDWDPALGARSAELPGSRLVLDFIYGYAGMLLPRACCALSEHWLPAGWLPAGWLLAGWLPAGCLPAACLLTIGVL